MRQRRWKIGELVPLFWEWVTAEKHERCTATGCPNIIEPGERVICVEEQHYESQAFKKRYWCTTCSPEKCKRLIEA